MSEINKDFISYISLFNILIDYNVVQQKDFYFISFSV